MKKTAVLACCALGLLLSGCGSSTSEIQDQSETLMTIGDTTYTKGDVYELIKESDGPDLVLSMALTDIYDKEVPVTDEIKEEAQAQYDELAASNEDLEQQLTDAGYSGKDEYIENILIPNVQSKQLTLMYFKDNEDLIVSEYEPSIAQIIQCSSEENANEALQALKDGDDVEKVADQYASETASFTGSEQVVTTQSTTLPTRLIKSLSSAKEAGILDEIFVNDDETSWYVAVLVSNNYEDNVDQYVDALSSNSTLAKEVVVSYLTKYGFEVHDQYLFDYFKANNPEYLVTRPDLSASDDD